MAKQEPKQKGKGQAKAQDGSGKKEQAQAVQEPGPPPRMRQHYFEHAVPHLKKRFGYQNTHQIPRLTKIVVNMGVGDALDNIKFLEAAAADLGTIAAQKPAIKKAKKSIASFKLREGNPIGTMVTLRGIRMYEFMDRMISVAIPRIRDFRGLPPKGFDGQGNYNFGIKEHIIFPEISYDKVEKIRGINVTMVTTADTDEEGFELLKAMRMPFRER
jgi:large subunit ribosomal protein L5